MASDDVVAHLLEDMQKQDPAVALARLEQAAQETNDPRVLLLLAGHYASLGRMDAAEAAYIALLQVAPAFSIARFQLGLLQFTSGRPAAAMATWAPIEQLEDGHYLRWFVQGFWHLARDEFDQSRQALRTGIAANAENMPLNQDMQMMIDQIGNLTGTQTGTSQAQTAQTAAEGQHVLLSGYKHLH